jgi:hypothetical protein
MQASIPYELCAQEWRDSRIRLSQNGANLLPCSDVNVRWKRRSGTEFPAQIQSGRRWLLHEFRYFCLSVAHRRRGISGVLG